MTNIPVNFDKYVQEAIKEQLQKQFDEILAAELPKFLENIEKQMGAKSIELMSRVGMMIREKFDMPGKDLIIKIPFDGFY